MFPSIDGDFCKQHIQKVLFLKISISFPSLIPCLNPPTDERETNERTPTQLPSLQKCVLKRINMRGLGERRLYEFRQMYKIYPQLGSQVLPFALKISNSEILRLPTAISEQGLGDTIVELKTDRFRHEYASQLNMYLNYYRHEVMQADDNPPIGLLLCTDYGKTSVQYATEGLSDNLFVSKYRLQLPSEDEIRKYLEENV